MTGVWKSSVAMFYKGACVDYGRHLRLVEPCRREDGGLGTWRFETVRERGFASLGKADGAAFRKCGYLYWFFLSSI